ncbi:MAG: hypothetical protein ACI4PL_04705 [Faecousia sp.]
MFTKLLKYEWRATRGMLGLMCLISLGAALAGGGTMRYLVWVGDAEESNLLIIVSALALVACILTIIICGVAGMFLYIWRFYKSRFTDEGFVTFTLPVTTHQILLSSMLNSAIGTAVLCLTICLCIPVLMLVGMSGIPEFLPELKEAWPRILEVLRSAFRQEGMKYLWITLLNIVLGFGEGLVMVMLSVTIGSVIAKKHKILAAVGCYYGISMVLSFLIGISTVFAALSERTDAFFGVFGTTSVITLIAAVGGYFLMYYLADRKLNLT